MAIDTRRKPTLDQATIGGTTVPPFSGGGGDPALSMVAELDLDFDNDPDQLFYTCPADQIFIPWLLIARKVSGADPTNVELFALGKNASRFDITGGNLLTGLRTPSGLTSGQVMNFFMRNTLSSGAAPAVTGQTPYPFLEAGDTIQLANGGGSGGLTVVRFNLLGLLIDV